MGRGGVKKTENWRKKKTKYQTENQKKKKSKPKKENLTAPNFIGSISVLDVRKPNRIPLHSKQRHFMLSIYT